MEFHLTRPCTSTERRATSKGYRRCFHPRMESAACRVCASRNFSRDTPLSERAYVYRLGATILRMQRGFFDPYGKPRRDAPCSKPRQAAEYQRTDEVRYRLPLTAVVIVIVPVDVTFRPSYKSLLVAFCSYLSENEIKNSHSINLIYQSITDGMYTCNDIRISLLSKRNERYVSL